MCRRHKKTYIHDTLSNLFSQLQFSLSFTDQDGFQSTLKSTTQRLAQDNPCTCLQKMGIPWKQWKWSTTTHWYGSCRQPGKPNTHHVRYMLSYPFRVIANAYLPCWCGLFMPTLLDHIISSVPVLCYLPILTVGSKTLHAFHHVSVYCRPGLESCSVNKNKSLLTAYSTGYKCLE